MCLENWEPRHVTTPWASTDSCRDRFTLFFTMWLIHIWSFYVWNIFFIDTFVSLAIPSLQLRLMTSLFSNLDSKLKTNSQYLSIDQCRVLVLICSHVLLRPCLEQIPPALCSAGMKYRYFSLIFNKEAWINNSDTCFVNIFSIQCNIMLIPEVSTKYCDLNVHRSENLKYHTIPSWLCISDSAMMSIILATKQLKVKVLLSQSELNYLKSWFVMFLL
jgi:hypothetical protein